MVTRKVALFLCLVSLLPAATLTQESVELMCTASATYAGVADNGQLMFTTPNQDSCMANASDVEYDPGALGPWYSISEGIITVVRPGSVTEGVIVPALNETVNISTTNVIESVNGPELLMSVVQWASGIIVLVVLGGVIAIGFLIWGCIFFPCRVCCKACGGDLKQKEHSYTNCLTITCTILLLVFTIAVVAGIVLAFLTNQQVYDVISETEKTANESLMDLDGFVDCSVTEYTDVFCTFDKTVNISIDKVEGFVDATLEDISVDVNAWIDRAVSVAKGINQSLYTLEDVNSTVTSLRSSTNNLNESLNNLADDMDNLSSSCMGVGVPQCATLNGNVFRDAVLADFFDVPIIDDVIENVEDVVAGVNLTAEAEQGTDTFENYKTNLTENAQPEIADILSEMNEIRDNVTAEYSIITNTSNMAKDLIVGLQNSLVSSSDDIQQVELARYVLATVICSLAAIVVVVVLVGVFCGIVGFRTDRAPYERTDLSNCGAYVLLCSVVLAVFFGSFLMILSALVFFTGSISFKFCEDLAGPDYILFNQTIDNPVVVGGEYVLSSVFYGNGSIPLTVSGILSNCSENATVYTALQLESSIDLQQLTNITEQFPNLTSEIVSITADQNLSKADFLSEDFRQRLENFTDSGIADINITQYQEQINAGIINNTLLEEQLMVLQNLSDTFTNEGMSSLANQANDIIMQIMAINQSVMNTEAQVDMLAVAVAQLNSISSNFTMTVNELLSDADSLVDEINDQLTNDAVNIGNEIVAGFNAFSDYLIPALGGEVANCYPVYAGYVELYNTFCETAVSSLNGLWLALGWSGIFLIPVAIFAVITSQYYRRMRFDEDLAIPYDDSFPLKTY